MQRARGTPRRLGHALGGAASRGSKRVVDAARVEHIQEGAQRRRLADARPTREHRDLGGVRQAHRRLLVRGQLDPQVALDGVEDLAPLGAGDRR